MGFFASLVEPITAFGGKVVGAWSANKEGKRRLVAQRIENQAREAKAETDFKVKQFEVRAERLTNQDAHEFTLDELAVKEASKSHWDEFLAFVWLLATTWYPIAIYPTILWYQSGTPPTPEEMKATLAALPWEVWVIDFGIMARYLGLRGFFTKMNVKDKLNKAKSVITGKGAEQ